MSSIPSTQLGGVKINQMSDIKSSHRGLLHKALDIPEGKTISVSDLFAAKSRAKKTGNKKLMKQATYAINVRGAGEPG